MHGNSLYELESLKLRSLYPNTANPPARIKAARWMLFGLAVFWFFGAPAVWFNDDMKLVNRRLILSVLFDVAGGICVFASLLAPAKAISSFCDLFGENNAIDTLLLNDKPDNWAGLLLECGILITLMIPIHLSMTLIFEAGKTTTGIAILVPIMLWSFSIMYRQKYRDSKTFKVLLKPTLESHGFEEHSITKSKSFLAGSFLRSDLSFDLDMYWMKPTASGSLYWGAYSSGGRTLSTGIFCCLDLHDTLTRTELAEKMSLHGSVNFDDTTQTVFGRLKAGGNPEFSLLDSIPWQYYGNVLICRLDEEELKEVLGRSDVPEQRLVDDLVETWSRFCENLA